LFQKNDWENWTGNCICQLAASRVQECPYRWAKAIVDPEGGYEIYEENPLTGKYRVWFYGDKRIVNKKDVDCALEIYINECDAPETIELVLTLKQDENNLQQEMEELKDELHSLDTKKQLLEQRVNAETNEARFREIEKEYMLKQLPIAQELLEKEKVIYATKKAAALEVIPGIKEILGIVKLMELKD